MGTTGSKLAIDSVQNDSNREKVFLIDEPSNSINEDDADDDSQIRYIYSLYKNRLSNNF